jgi:transcriptional regulator with XRE-family HTH domain
LAHTPFQPARDIGEKLREARKRADMSLRELADRAEVSASMLSQIENGKAVPSVRLLYSIAAALALPVDHFFPVGARGAAAPPGEEAASLPTASDMREAQRAGAAEARFADAARPASAPVVHADDRPTIKLRGDVVWSRLTAEAETGVEFLEISYAPGATSGDHMSHHAGREFGLILEGELTIELGFESHTLRQGDSIIFDSSTPHRLTNKCDKPMRAVWVVLEQK